MDSLATIKVGCWLHFDYDDNFKDYNSIEFDTCLKLVTKWMETPKANGDIIALFSGMEVTFERYDKQYDHAIVNGGGSGINLDFRRLHSPNSALLQKARKYDEVVERQSLPYIICFHLDFHSWFSKEDVYNALYGLSCGNYDVNDQMTSSHYIG